MSRSIFGWDLPPGVRTCDLPGNRPEDMEAEAYAEAHFDLLMRAHRNGSTLEEFIEQTKADWPEAVKEEDRLQAEEAEAEAEMYRQMEEAERLMEEREDFTGRDRDANVH